MVAISPFRALRYSPERIANLSEVLAPPYDVINAEQQEQLYQISPYNVVRLILGKQYPNDTTAENRYTRAQRDFQAWRDNRVLCRDEAPAVYLIAHRFSVDGHHRCRLGFIALLQLDDQTRRTVLRHEETLAAPKEDRTKLLEAIPANLEPIFCIYPDEQGAVQRELERLSASEPLLRAQLNGEDVQVWALTEPGAVETITHPLASTAVLIADGHHRFEVAYANRQRYDVLMSYFVSMADPGLLMRPIHRLVHEGGLDIHALRSLCIVEPSVNLDSLLQWLTQQENQGCFGYGDGSGLFRVSLKPELLARWLMTPSLPQPVAGLDVAILSGVLLGQGTGVRYSADAAEALQEVQSGKAKAAWLLRSIPLSHVYALAAQGVTFPPKSTYFYPKVPSGLAMNLLR